MNKIQRVTEIPEIFKNFNEWAKAEGKIIYNILTAVIVFDIIVIIFSFWVDYIMTALFVVLLILAIICKNRVYYSVDITFVEGSSRFARVINNSKRFDRKDMLNNYKNLLTR